MEGPSPAQQMVWITSLYGLGFPRDSEQAWVVCRFCVVLTFYRYFSLSLLSDNSPFSPVRMRAEQQSVHHSHLSVHTLWLLFTPGVQLCHCSTFSFFSSLSLFLCTSLSRFIKTKQACLQYSSWQIVIFKDDGKQKYDSRASFTSRIFL